MRTVVLTILVFLAAAGLASLLMPSVIRQGSAYDQYFCTICGLERADDLRSFGPVTYRRQVTFEESSISRVLKHSECQHRWLLFRFGHSFRGLLVGGSLDGGCQSLAIPHLLRDDVFAREFARMDGAGKAWGSLVAALNTNRAFDEAFLEWRNDFESINFSSWSATNGYWSPTINK